MTAAGFAERVVDARDEYLSTNGLSTSQYTDAWFDLRVAGVDLRLPNPRQLRLSVRHHDLHHVATGFGSSLRDELLIGAWEVGAGL